MKIRYQTIYKMVMMLLASAGVFLVITYMLLRPDASANQKEKGRLIGASYMTMNNEFYEILHEQISHRVEAEGDRVILRDPALSVDRQVEQIEMMLDKGINNTLISSILGHTSSSSVEPYLNTDFSHLKECALSIERYPLIGGSDK